MTKTETNNIANAHWKKIDIIDAIYVVNVGGYIGNSTNNEIKYALSNSLGFGGHNACVILKKYAE